MTPFGFAPTQTIPRVTTARAVTAPALAAPSAVRPGTLVTYSGSSARNHGQWICDGPCRCGCGGLELWRRERDGRHGLVHVSVFSVTGGFRHE